MARASLITKIVAAAAAALVTTAPFANAAGGRAAAELILTHLPAHGSGDYEKLRRLAGTSTIIPLELTGGEVWHIPRTRLAVFTEFANEKHIDIIRVDRPQSRIMTSLVRSAAMSARQKDMRRMSMAEPASTGITMMAAAPAPLVELELKRAMETMHSTGVGPTIRIPLEPGRTVTVRALSIEKTPDGYAWSGETVDGGEPATFLWSKDGHIAGSFNLGKRVFSIRPMGGMMHGIVEQSTAQMPPEHAPAPAGMLEKMGMHEDPLVMQGDAGMLRPRAPGAGRSQADGKATAERQATITVLVAYTAAAARHYDNIARDLIALAIEEANQSFRASGIENVRLKLVGAYQTDYVESGTHFDHVWRFADRGDGYMDEVHAERDRTSADVAVLIVDDAKGCGLSTRVAADAEEAFTVVHHGCAASMYSLAHEIGHLIGARHDPALDSHNEPFAYGHGFINGTKWRTVMSYKDACHGCIRLPIWSSPDVRVGGEIAGSATADNARVVREGAGRVARFRRDGQEAADEIENAAAPKTGAEP